MSLGEKIRKRRERLKLDQHELAALIDSGQASVCDWELGKTKPRRERLAAIAAALRLSEKRLLAWWLAS